MLESLLCDPCTVHDNSLRVFAMALGALLSLMAIGITAKLFRRYVVDRFARAFAAFLCWVGQDYTTGKHSRNPVKVINGGPGGHETAYMARIIYTPNTPWGQGYLHCFLRHDIDRDPHDHPFGFWTMPLNRSYVEEVFDADTHCFKYVHVRRWRWHFRPATHCHRVVGALTLENEPRSLSERAFPLYTLVWRQPTSRQWGFWTLRDNPLRRGFVHWKEYVAGKGGDNRYSPNDVMCPGGMQPADRL